MKIATRTLHLLLMGLVLTAPWLVAQDETAEAVRQQIRDMHQMYKAGDFDAYLEGYAIGATRFRTRGDRLRPPYTEQSLAAQAARFKANYAAGARDDTTVEDIAVQVYGSTAVATYYREGRITNANKETRSVVRRVSQVFVEDGGTWKVVHTHLSDLVQPSE